MIRLLVIFWILLPFPLMAETVVVRTGDHADFSRLLLDYDGGLDWTFGQVAGGYEFRPERGDLVWDLQRSFDRITRSRIGDLVDRRIGRLFIAVTCDCHADVFTLRDGQIVIDIKDGPSPFRNSSFEEKLAPIGDTSGPQVAAGFVATPENARELPRGNSERPYVSDRAGLPLMLPLVPSQRSATMRRSSGAPGSEFSEREPADDTGTSERNSPAVPEAVNRVAETETALLAQIARAAAQGMVDADMSRIENDVRHATDPLDLPDQKAPEPLPPPVPPPSIAPRSHMSIETGVDRAVQPEDRAVPRTDNGLMCIDSSFFDVASWGPVESTAADIGAYRSKIIGEFDLANSQGVTSLARFYLYLTFGAETKALLRQFPGDVERPDLLELMADIMDRGNPKNARTLAPQVGCDGPTALWAVLAQPRLAGGQTVNTKAVTLAFAGLPPHLRRHLGPGLAEKFIERGDLATAQRIRNAIERGADGNEPELSLLSARLDLAAGEPDAASEKLDQAVASDSDALPQALITKVKTLIDSGKSVPLDQIALLESLSFENKGTATGGVLLETEIRARAASGDFATAFERMDMAVGAAYFPTERISPLATELFDRLARNAGDVTFLNLVVPRIEQSVGLPALTRRMIAARFLDVGLAAPARRILAGGGAVPEKADRVLFARAALLEGHPEVAVGYLAGLADEESNSLRAEALEAAGDFAQASSLFDAIGAPERGTSSAWKGGIWDTLVERDAGALSAAAQLMMGQQMLAEDQLHAEGAPEPQVEAGSARETTPLALSQSLVDRSRAARAVLDDLLQEIPAFPASAGS